MDTQLIELLNELESVRERDGFNDEVKRVATLLSWGQDVSRFDPLIVAAANVFLSWESN